MHQVRMFIVDGQIVYIHHDTNHPAHDQPGNSLRVRPGEKVRFTSRDGGFSIEFKTESPFVSGAGAPGRPIVSSNGSFTPAQTIKRTISVTKRFLYTTTLANIIGDAEIIVDDGGGARGSAKKAKRPK